MIAQSRALDEAELDRDALRLHAVGRQLRGAEFLQPGPCRAGTVVERAREFEIVGGHFPFDVGCNRGLVEAQPAGLFRPDQPSQVERQPESAFRLRAPGDKSRNDGDDDTLHGPYPLPRPIHLGTFQAHRKALKADAAAEAGRVADLAAFCVVILLVAVTVLGMGVL